MPVALEKHENSGAINYHNNGFDLEHSISKLKSVLKKKLSPKDYEIFLMLFIEKDDDKAIAKKLNLISNEKGRKAGYKQIKNIKKKIKEKVLLIIQKEDIV